MKLLDKIALNNLIRIITNFIIALLKIFDVKTPVDNPILKPKRPILDKLRNIFKK
jgi:hypothetical protein